MNRFIACILLLFASDLIQQPIVFDGINPSLLIVNAVCVQNSSWIQYVKTPATFDRKNLNNKFTLWNWFGRLGNNFR